jgi:hypothetical protein
VKPVEELDNQNCSAMTKIHAMRKGIQKRKPESKLLSKWTLETASHSKIIDALLGQDMVLKDRDKEGAAVLSLESGTVHRSRECQGADITMSDNSMANVGNSSTVLSPAQSDRAGSFMEIDMDNSVLENYPGQSPIEQLESNKGLDFAGKAHGVNCSDICGSDQSACLVNNQGHEEELQKKGGVVARQNTKNRSNQCSRPPDASLIHPALSLSLGQPVNDPNRQVPYGALAVDNHETNHNAAVSSVDHSMQSPSFVRFVGTSEARELNANYIIIAKNILPCNQRQDQQVMDGTRCIVQDPQGRHNIMTWSQIEQKHQRGLLFEDNDFGYGIHTKVDRDLLKRPKSQNNNLSDMRNFQVVDAVMHQSKEETVHYITVFLELKNKALADELSRIRTSAGYDYPGPIRCSVSDFLAAGGKRSDVERILKQKQPIAFKIYQEFRRKLRAGKSSTSYHQGKIEQFLGSLLDRVHKIEFASA